MSDKKPPRPQTGQVGLGNKRYHNTIDYTEVERNKNTATKQYAKGPESVISGTSEQINSLKPGRFLKTNL